MCCPGVVGEELRALVLQGERDDALAELVGADRGARQLLPGEERRELLLVDRVALVLRHLAERHEVQPARLADQPADRVRVGHARQLDDDPVAALGRDERLGDAGRVHPVLHDLADDLEVLGPRDPVADLLRLVLDAEAALQVQPELRLDRAAGRCRRIGEGETRNEVDDEGEDADDEDQDRTGFAHQRRMIQDRLGIPGSGFLTVPVRPRSVLVPLSAARRFRLGLPSLLGCHPDRAVR